MAARFSRCKVEGLSETPGWWQVRCEQINAAVRAVKKGGVEELGTTANGWPVWAVSYGGKRPGAGTATWAIGSNSRNVGSYKTEEEGRQTVMIVSGVHGAEAESVAGCVNLIALLETGADLRGQRRDELVKLIGEYRLVILPCVNMDGRDVSPDHLRGASPED